MDTKYFYYKAEGMIVTRNDDDGSYRFYAWVEDAMKGRTELTEAEVDATLANVVSREEVEAHEVQN